MQGQRRLADVIGNAALIVRIATGEEEEAPMDGSMQSATAEMGRNGSKARAKAMTPGCRAEIDRKAAKKRWGSKRRQAAQLATESS